MLLEDEHGTINLIVPPPVHERFRLAVRAEPLVLAAGRLERREGTINVLVDRDRAPRAPGPADGRGQPHRAAPRVEHRDPGGGGSARGRPGGVTASAGEAG